MVLTGISTVVGKAKKITWKIFGLRLLLTMFLTAITGEVAIRLGAFVFLPPNFGVAFLAEKQFTLTQQEMFRRRSVQPNVLHPYVGFVVDPTRNTRCNSFGFWQVDGPILERSADSVIIGITGGSVARELCEYSSEVLRERLSMQLGRKVRIVCLAQDGFREPQLAMTVSYFQTLGAKFGSARNEVRRSK